MQDSVHRFLDYISTNGLKNTPQRRLIAEVFFESGKHLSIEELYDIVRAKDASIGQATVYRTLKLLCKAGFAGEHHFGETTARYEPIVDDSHHDHLICDSCGKNIEIMDEKIERRQEQVARQHGFRLISHRMILHGICADCRKQGRNVKRPLPQPDAN